jgi:TetR/AcrR family transcriptional regulator
MTQPAPRSRDPEAVRTAVLDAALPLFAEKGFADTSLRDISAASGVSHPLILHHFGSKDDLYAAVKRRVVEGYAHRFPEAARATDQPIDIRAEMERILTYVGENELALKLCARTRVDGDHQVWPGEPDLLDLIRQRIEVAQRSAKVRDDLDPSLLSILILGTVFFWLDNRQHFAQRFQKPADDAAYLKAAITVIEEGLLPRSSGSSETKPTPD